MALSRFSLTALAAVAAATTLTAIPTAAEAQRYHGEREYYRDHGPRYGHRYRPHYRDRVVVVRPGYYGRGYYYGGRSYYGGRGYRDRGYRCGNGAGGTILGAIAGGLIGNAAVGRHGDNTAGAIAGAGVGALAGRAIDRDC